jgi:molecular chaperone DnaK
MQKDAEENAEKDKERKEKVEAHNHLDSLIYQAEKTVKEATELKKDELNDLVKAVEEKLEKSREILKDDEKSTEELKTEKEELEKTLMALGQKMHELGADAHAADGEKKAEDSGEEEIKEAEFEEVNADE